jgi:hypothetical protein
MPRGRKPAGVPIGFDVDGDRFAYRLATDPRFLRRIEKARAHPRAGRGLRVEDIDAA